MVKVKDGTIADEATAIWCCCQDPCRDVDHEDSTCLTRSGIWLGPVLSTADALEQFAAHNSIGAIATFAGATRERDRDDIVSHLHYEAYPALAMKQLQSICRQIRMKWNVARIAIQHRIGDVAVGQVSVRIAISSEHRAEALAAVEFAIDQLKASVAIFKREHYVNRAASWKPNQTVQQSEPDSYINQEG